MPVGVADGLQSVLMGLAAKKSWEEHRPVKISEIIDFTKSDKDFTAADEDVLSISKQLMEQNKEAYEVLAK